MVGWFTQHLLLSVLLAVMVAVICGLLRPRPAVRHALWLVVLIKLLLPSPPIWPCPEFVTNASRSTAGIGDGAFQMPPVDLTSDLVNATPKPKLSIHEMEERRKRLEANPSVGAQTPSLPAIDTTTSGDRTTASIGVAMTEPTSLDWRWVGITTGVGVWLLGTVVMGWIHLRRIARFRRSLRSAQRAPRRLIHEIRELADALGVRPPFPLVVHGIASPVLWCFGRSRLLWPGDLLERFGADRRRSILIHELAHLRRRDHWVGWLLLVGECVWWWNPLFWLIRRQIRENAELACDGWVVTLLPDQRRSYAETLIEVSRLHSRPAAPAPAMGIGGARRSFQRRLTMILCERTPCRLSRVGLLLIGLLAIVALPGWSTGQTKTPPQVDKSKSMQSVEELRNALAELEKKREVWEAELKAMRDQLVVFQELAKKNQEAARRAVEMERDRATLVDQLTANQQLADSYQKALTQQRDAAQYAESVARRGNLSTSRAVANKINRSWGPEQAVGAPNCQGTGDNSSAWASLSEDGQDEWLTLDYAEAVTPVAVLIYENYCPGAVSLVSVFTADGREMQIWKGRDPLAGTTDAGVALIPLKTELKALKIKKLKIYLKSKEVKGWNEIDAVGLLDAAGKIHWATHAEASSTYAEQRQPDYIDGVVVTGHDRWINATQPTVNPRLDKLEKDMQEMKELLQKLLKQQSSHTPQESLRLWITGQDDLKRTQLENADLRDELKKLRQFHEAGSLNPKK